MSLNVLYVFCLSLLTFSTYPLTLYSTPFLLSFFFAYTFLSVLNLFILQVHSFMWRSTLLTKKAHASLHHPVRCHPALLSAKYREERTYVMLVAHKGSCTSIALDILFLVSALEEMGQIARIYLVAVSKPVFDNSHTALILIHVLAIFSSE